MAIPYKWKALRAERIIREMKKATAQVHDLSGRLRVCEGVIAQKNTQLNRIRLELLKGG